MKYKLTFQDNSTGLRFEANVATELVTKVIQALLKEDITLTGLVQAD